MGNLERAGQLLVRAALLTEVDVLGADSVDITDRHRSITVEGVAGAQVVRVVRVEGLVAHALVGARTLRT